MVHYAAPARHDQHPLAPLDRPRRWTGRTADRTGPARSHRQRRVDGRRNFLPSTRALSASLGVARGTVTEAFAQVAGRGLSGNRNVGAGTRVASTLAEQTRAVLPPVARSPKSAPKTAPIQLPPRAIRLAKVAAAFTPMPECPVCNRGPRRRRRTRRPMASPRQTGCAPRARRRHRAMAIRAALIELRQAIARLCAQYPARCIASPSRS